jgi:hypothetical protein
MERQEGYHAYLLRLWSRRVDGREVCGVTLQDIETGQRKSLPDLESLVEFLSAQVGLESDPAEFPV